MRIVIAHITERLPKRLEPWLVIAPFLEAVPGDGFSDLLGTHGDDGTLGPVKLDTGGLERQPEIIEQPADLVFRAFHQLFIHHAVNLPWKNGVEMRHQCDVVAVVLRDVGEACGILLVAGKQLDEI